MELKIGLIEQDAERALSSDLAHQLAGKTVLIAGASGMVGAHFLYGLRHCLRDLGRPLEIIGVGQRLPPHLSPLVSDKSVRFLCGDLTENRFLDSLPRADIIVHAATYAQPGKFMANAESTLRLNTTATFGLFEKLRPNGRALFLSTSEVYSGLAKPPFSEEQIGTTNTDHPRSCYIEAKRCGEAICQAYRAKGWEIRAARLSLAYGPGTQPGDQRVLSAFIERGLKEGRIQLLDQGQATRSYCYIADAMRMLWRILLDGKQGIYNVGGVSRTSISDLAKLVGVLLGVPVELPQATPSGLAGAPDDVSLNLARFIKEFGPFDFTPLEKGVARAISWQKSWMPR